MDMYLIFARGDACGKVHSEMSQRRDFSKFIVSRISDVQGKVI